jgi:Xaa-Pro dipeptidase
VLELRYLEAAFPQAEFVDGSAAIARLRRIKDAGEVAAMQRAAEIAEAALAATLKQVKVGMTERQIAGLLVTEILKAGSDTHLPFAPIVASGPNSANPHAAPGDRQLQAGDLLLFDWGASMDGYFSDITRTFAVGEISEELKRIYEVVRLANQAGREAGKPGTAAATVDIAARDAIEDNGYGEYFIHRTGHGLGMEPHEEPWIRGDNQAKLEEGMAFTVEPGIYLPDKGGVRIEDNVVVTADGLKSLTTFPRELQVLGV